MDKFEKAILEEVQHNCRLTAEQLSEKVGLSPSACQRRLQMMRENGIIQKEIAVVSPKAVGQHLLMIVEVELERERTELIDNFKRSMLKIPEVMQCFYVTGNTDFILIVSAPDMSAYERFSRKFFFENPNIRRFRTNVVMDHVNTGLYVPINDDTANG